jgi:photosystem II stability/assembly factor-like uncharacterized protein
LSDVTFPDSRDGWAVGRQGQGTGLILRSTDGGLTWVPAGVPTSAPELSDLDTITFVDPLHGWAGGWMTIARTSDGGQTWAVQGLPQGGYGRNVSDIAFSDADHGWAVGVVNTLRDSSSDLLMETSDAGQTWTDRTNYNRSSMAGGYNSIEVVSPDLLFVSDSAGRVQKSSDAGKTWQDVATISMDGPAGNESLHTPPNLGHVLFSDSDHGWVSTAFLGDHFAGEFCKTDDGGLTWQGQSLRGQNFGCSNGR